ncbi:MAG: hypothetical protein IPG25_16445 [Proteobacteria bacterium]|nr:hypothetical protein [Pseudomonadota bacterium]
MREVVRYVQAARKNAGLNVDDRIVLSFTTDIEELQQAIAEHDSTIQAETLAVLLGDVTAGHEETVKIEGMELQVCLKKSS